MMFSEQNWDFYFSQMWRSKQRFHELKAELKCGTSAVVITVPVLWVWYIPQLNFIFVFQLKKKKDSSKQTGNRTLFWQDLSASGLQSVLGNVPYPCCTELLILSEVTIKNTPRLLWSVVTLAYRCNCCICLLGKYIGN